ncbi:MAG: hypothetical protein NTX50_02665 [Candidatus Sumerlaeota bacterium]|nr:hypothetical protein [Candidatus Sumerlaeota bacterium]
MGLTKYEISGKPFINGIVPDTDDDLLIVSASYESRCLSVSNCLADTYKVRRGAACCFREFLDHKNCGEVVRMHMERLKDNIAKHTRVPIISEAIGSWLDAKTEIEQLQRLMKELRSELGELSKVTVDVTTFNRESLAVLLSLLSCYFQDAKIRILYTKPNDYGAWLSRGFRRVRNIAGFPGILLPSRQTILIVLSGFEDERAINIIDRIEPASVYLGIGDPPTDDKFLRRNELTSRIIMARQDMKRFTFQADDVEACTKQLVNLIKDLRKSFNIILAPMSSKLSTVAAIRVALAFPDIQLVYGIPGEYNVQDYSKGEATIYETIIPTFELREEGRSIGDTE